MSDFINFRKNTTGQFYELIEYHYCRQTSENLEKAIEDICEFLPNQLPSKKLDFEDEQEFKKKHNIPHPIFYSVEDFLVKCDEFLKDKGYWERDIIECL